MNSGADMDDRSPSRPPACNACGGRGFSVMARRRDGIDVWCCDACGMGVVASMMADLAALYDDAYYGGDGTADALGYEDYRFTAEHGVSWAAAIVPLLKGGGRVLDIGCADGTLLQKLPTSFQLYGIEVNGSMAARAARAGATLIGRDLLAPDVLRDYHDSFDVVTAIAVFEHLPDFRRGMQIAIELLKPDGILLFEVPYISARHDNRAWFESSLEHVYYPSRDSLRRLSESLGAHLVGGELYIRDYASTCIGLIARDAALVPNLQGLFDALTGDGEVALTTEQRDARFHLMLVHAANSSPELIAGLAEILTKSANPRLLRRIEQLWRNDLLRVEQFRAVRGVLSGVFGRRISRAAGALHRLSKRHNRIARKLQG